MNTIAMLGRIGQRFSVHAVDDHTDRRTASRSPSAEQVAARPARRRRSSMLLRPTCSAWRNAASARSGPVPMRCRAPDRCNSTTLNECPTRSWSSWAIRRRSSAAAAVASCACASRIVTISRRCWSTIVPSVAESSNPVIQMPKIPYRPSTAPASRRRRRRRRRRQRDYARTDAQQRAHAGGIDLRAVRTHAATPEVESRRCIPPRWEVQAGPREEHRAISERSAFERLLVRRFRSLGFALLLQCLAGLLAVSALR